MARTRTSTGQTAPVTGVKDAYGLILAARFVTGATAGLVKHLPRETTLKIVRDLQPQGHSS